MDTSNNGNRSYSKSQIRNIQYEIRLADKKICSVNYKSYFFHHLSLYLILIKFLLLKNKIRSVYGKPLIRKNYKIDLKHFFA